MSLTHTKPMMSKWGRLAGHTTPLVPLVLAAVSGDTTGADRMRRSDSTCARISQDTAAGGVEVGVEPGARRQG